MSELQTHEIYRSEENLGIAGRTRRKAMEVVEAAATSYGTECDGTPKLLLRVTTSFARQSEGASAAGWASAFSNVDATVCRSGEAVESLMQPTAASPLPAPGRAAVDSNSLGGCRATYQVYPGLDQQTSEPGWHLAFESVSTAEQTARRSACERGPAAFAIGAPKFGPGEPAAVLPSAPGEVPVFAEDRSGARVAMEDDDAFVAWLVRRGDALGLHGLAIYPASLEEGRFERKPFPLEDVSPADAQAFDVYQPSRVGLQLV